MTVAQLAQELGISVKEALALCLVAGVKARDASTFLGPADVEAIRKVLAGEKKLIDPTRPGGSGYRKSRVGREAALAAIVIGIVALVLIGITVLPRLGGPARISVAAGDCFDATLFGSTVFGGDIEPTPCDEASYRAFAVLDLEEVFPTWPGREAIIERAKDRCMAIGEQVITEEGFVSVYYFGPADETAWESPEARKIVCAEPTG